MENETLPQGTAETVETVGHDQEQEKNSSTESHFKAPQSQSELDSIVNKAVQTALTNNKKGEAERIEQAVADALQKEKDYANLSAKDREKKEFEEQQAQFVADREAFEREKLLVSVEKDLVAKGLPSSLAEVFTSAGDAEKALKAVNNFEKIFNAAVADKVKETIRQTTPQVTSGTSANTNFGARLAQKYARTDGKIV